MCALRVSKYIVIYRQHLFAFKKDICLQTHKRVFTDLDVGILDAYRTHISQGIIHTIENNKS